VRNIAKYYQAEAEIKAYEAALCRLREFSFSIEPTLCIAEYFDKLQVSRLLPGKLEKSSMFCDVGELSEE
jgi:hypothetical protein